MVRGLVNRLRYEDAYRTVWSEDNWELEFTAEAGHEYQVYMTHGSALGPLKGQRFDFGVLDRDTEEWMASKIRVLALSPLRGRVPARTRCSTPVNRSPST